MVESTISSCQMVLMLAYPKELIIVSSTINCSFWRIKHLFFLADFGKLSNLERLDCRHNQLTSVPLLSSCQSLKVRVILNSSTLPMVRTGLEKSLKKHHVLEKSLKIEKLWDILETSLNFPQKSLNVF